MDSYGASPATAAVSRRVVVERWVSGRDYRVLVVNGKVVACAERVPAHVVGDGASPVQELVALANRDPRRGRGHRSPLTLLAIDERAERLLARQGHGARSVPDAGETVALCEVANLSAGGTAVDVTDQVHPDNRTMAVRAALAVGLDVVGVDFLTTDITRSYREAGGAICEINDKPGLRMHVWPSEGTPRDVIAPILDMLFPGLNDPDLRAKFAQLEAAPLVFTPAEYGAFLVSEAERWGKAVKEAGATAE